MLHNCKWSYFGIFGRDVQSQTISDAVTPFEEEFEKGGVELGPLVALAEYPWIPTGSVLILFTYTPLSSSANVASSQLGLFGGDFGLIVKKYITIHKDTRHND